MSLKIEQCLDDNYFTDTEPKIHTTGAYLIPLEIYKNNKKRYVWVVDEFSDDTFNKGGEICHPNVYSNKIKDLLNND